MIEDGAALFRAVVLDSTGAADAACFQPLTMVLPADPAANQALAGPRAYRIRCP